MLIFCNMWKIINDIYFMINILLNWLLILLVNCIRWNIKNKKSNINNIEFIKFIFFLIIEKIKLVWFLGI